MLKVKDFIKDREIFRGEDAPDNPSISVIMPIYCHNGILLERAIESVLRQTFENFELIIIDDGSRDGSFNTAIKYMEKDNRITIISHKLNCGLPALRINEGIMESRGDYIAYQFDDDEYLPNCLRDLYSEIQKHEEPCAVYGTTTLHIDRHNGNGLEQIRIGSPFNYALLNNQNSIANNSILHHRGAMKLSGMYDPHIIIRRLCDYDLWRRMGKYLPFYYIEKDVTNVYANQSGSLGADVSISSMASVRRYLEIDRNNLLTPENIYEYDIDDMNQYHKEFKLKDIDYIYRREIFPFLNRSTYYIPEEQKQTYGISRSKQRDLIVLKSDYSTSIDVDIKNFLTRDRKIPYTFSFVKGSNYSTVSSHHYDLAIFFRCISPIERRYMQYCKKNNIASAYWIDDNMFKFHEVGEEFAYLAPGSVGAEYLKEIVNQSDVVVSYSKIISKDCRPYNNIIFELKTNIPQKYLVEKNEFYCNKIHFGVFSGNVRKKVFGQLWEALERIAQEYMDKISITFWGINPDDFAPLHCETHYSTFTHSYDQYLIKLKNNQFHYQICPLEGETDADKSKSPIKYLEGTATGAVGLFSNKMPYDSLPDDCCIKVENTVEDWYQALKKAVETPEEKRYAVYKNALSDIKKRFTTESQSIQFLTALDATILHNNLKRKKIAYVAHESYLGGATLHILRHALLLRSLGFEILMYLPDNFVNIPDFPDYAKQFGVEVHFIPCRRSITPIDRSNQDYKDAQVIVELFSKQNVGMIHAATNFPAFGIVAERMGIPNVATLHQYYPNPNGFKEVDCNIQVIHSSSNRYANEWQQVLNVPAYRIVCPVDDIFFDMYKDNLDYNVKHADKKECINIILSGTLQERKNQLGGIRAVKILMDRGFNIHLYLVGYDTLVKDYVQKCRDEITALGLENSVEIMGFTNTSEIYYNKKCQILLCSAENESMPQTILQAMAAGVYVVSTNCGGVMEIIKNNYNGIITLGLEDECIADGIERIVTMDEDMRRKLLQNAQDTIAAIADKEFVRSELLYLYNTAFDRVDKIVEKQKVNGTEKVVSVVQPAIPASVKVEENSFVLPLSTKKGFTEVMGGRNLANKSRRFSVIMRTGKITGIRFLMATEGGICKGKLKAELYVQGHLLEQCEISTEKYGVSGEAKWDFTPISCSSGEELQLVLTYMSADSSDWLCIYEKRKPLSLWNRILYKLNWKNSYEIEGKGIFK